MSIPCGIPFVSTNCKARVDRRYETSIKFDLESNDDFWKDFKGLYYAKDYRIDDENQAITTVFPPIDNETLRPMLNYPEDIDIGWSASPKELFLNITIVGSRLLIHKILFAKDNFGNRPGFLNAVDEYYTSSHEKNGVAFLVAYSTGVVGHSSQLQLLPRGSSRIEPSSNITAIFQHDTSQVEYIDTPDLTIGSIFLEPHPNWIEESYNKVETNEDVRNRIVSFGRKSAKKVNETEWMAKMQHVMEEFRIPPEPSTGKFNHKVFAAPDLSKECLTGKCMTEEMWRVTDPNYNATPYVDEGTFTLAFISTLCGVIFLIFGTVVYRMYSSWQKNRNAKVVDIFSKAVAQRHGLTKRRISSKEALEMFQAQDKDGSGAIDQNELKILLREAGIARLKSKEFKLLFKAIDIDNNGSVNFLEFLVFLNSLPNADGSDHKIEDSRKTKSRSSWMPFGKEKEEFEDLLGTSN